VQSVIEMEEEEIDRERWNGALGHNPFGSDGGRFTNLLFGSKTYSASPFVGGGALDWGETDDAYGLSESIIGRRRLLKVSDLTSRKYLTMNWWLLNVGWRNVMDRVKGAVNEVLEE